MNRYSEAEMEARRQRLERERQQGEEFSRLLRERYQNIQIPLSALTGNPEDDGKPEDSGGNAS
jgi:hypothetical protein